jgi:hypothetical protein
MEVDGEWQVERPDSGRQALGGMRGAVVQDQVETANPPTPDTAEEHPQEALELDGVSGSTPQRFIIRPKGRNPVGLKPAR